MTDSMDLAVDENWNITAQTQESIVLMLEIFWVSGVCHDWVNKRKFFILQSKPEVYLIKIHEIYAKKWKLWLLELYNFIK